jgi:probable FeS assembly SUF system protein SufT
MMEESERILSRDVKATLIPHGESMTLPEGAKVTITHRLGGNYTVMTENGMFRIDGIDADSLGEEPEKPDFATDGSETDGPPSEESVWGQLRKVFDPEIPVNIVDLGLVYSMKSEERKEGGYRVDVAMTLTAPGCGMGPSIAEDARSKLVQLPGVEEAQVDIVWDPPWNQEMISETGKMELGLM